MLLRWGGAAAAVAAGIALAFWHPFLRLAAERQTAPMVAVRPETPTGYTMLDAYVVARELSRGEAPEAKWDLNHDGRVDQRDVERIAQEAVRLQ